MVLFLLWLPFLPRNLETKRERGSKLSIASIIESIRIISAKHLMKQLTGVIIFFPVFAQQVFVLFEIRRLRFSSWSLAPASESQIRRLKRRSRKKNALFKRISIREKTRQMGSYVVRLLSCRRFNDGLLPLLSVLITTGFDIVTASALYHGRRGDRL